MYYKITNKECEVFQKLQKLRNEEIQIGKDNEQTIQNVTGLTWQEYLGHAGQQNFRRTTQYTGFKFIETENICKETWKESDDFNEYFIPNRRTKKGREMYSLLLNGLKSSNYNLVFEILNIEHGNRFIFPYVESFNDVIILFLDNKHEPKDENIIEITKKEFEAIFESAN